MINKLMNIIQDKIGPPKSSKMYTRCAKLIEDYSEEQLLKMYGEEKTKFIKQNPEEWI